MPLLETVSQSSEVGAMKAEMSHTSLAETYCGSESVSSDLSEMGNDKTPTSDSADGGVQEQSALSNAPDVPPPPSVVVPRVKKPSVAVPRVNKLQMKLTAAWAPHVTNCECPVDDDYHTLPPASFAEQDVKANYVSVPSIAQGGNSELLKTVIEHTPKPKGQSSFASVHVVAPAASFSPTLVKPLLENLKSGASDEGLDLHIHRLPERGCRKDSTAMEEYESIFETATSLIHAKATRASLLVYVGWEDHSKDAYAALIGMLPFRGISTALLTQREDHGDLLLYALPSGVFQVNGRDAARVGNFPIRAVFGPLPPTSASAPVKPWQPVDLIKAGIDQDSEAVQLPFKLGGLVIPMVNHNAEYSEAVRALGSSVKSHFADGSFYPIVSCGESGDGLGYGQDVLDAMEVPGLLFPHRSGEVYKRPDNYCSTALCEGIATARADGRVPLILAVGGGVNGNCIGLIAALTGCAFIEIPTTPLHYNDACTSAKKAFNLVVHDKVLTKNILGAYYIPQLVFCVNEMLLTSSSANIHAVVGEASKTMNMLGMAGSATGARDYFNVLGASEFASNTISILRTAGGFNRLVKLATSAAFVASKHQVMKLAHEISALRKAAQKDKSAEGKLTDLLHERAAKMQELRGQFHSLGEEDQSSIKEFLTIINREIVAAKAMFLAYSDPFEKYRGLLFEYAHTLGHGVEAYAAGLYERCAKEGIPVPDEAIRLHGQCVGMAVLWAGRMSQQLGLLDGTGLLLHQALGYLFNRYNGFSFKPLRELCDTAGVSKAEFCEEVLKVVRRDNKRGLVATADPSKSVDQLVTQRPGKMVRSDDINAELRYLVEVDEDWQRKVIHEGFEGHFDKVADLVNGELVFVDACSPCQSDIEEVSEFLYNQLANMYSAC